MILIFSSLTMLSCLTISYLIYQSSVELVTKSIGNQAEIIVKRVMTQIDVQDYLDINAKSGETDYYYELREKLNLIKETNGIDYLYTMGRQKKGNGYEYFYVVDGMPKNDKSAATIGEIEKDMESFPKIVETFETGKIRTEMTNTKDYGGVLSAYAPIKSTNGEIIGIVGADINVNHVYKGLQSNKLRVLLITGLILLVSILIVFSFSVYLIRPLKRLATGVKLVGEGNLSTNFQLNRHDEIGALSVEFQKMTENIKTMIHGIQVHSSQLNDTAGNLTDRTNETIFASKQIASSIQEIASGSELQSKSSEESANAMESMADGIQSIATASSNVSDLSALTLQETELGNAKVISVVRQMNEIDKSVEETAETIAELQRRSDEIAEITTVIQAISAQTNLLALNAAIEAAHAGENGKGFAVVADEVKKLAEQSAISANHISDIIKGIHTDTNRSVRAMSNVTSDVKDGIVAAEEAGETFGKILNSIQKVVQQIHEVSSISEEMSAVTEQVSASVLENAKIADYTANNTKEVATATQEQESHMSSMASSIKELSEMANGLEGLIKKFKL
ncbi:methyl-accepting chemotaxis protein [Bacillus sp. cl95]|uniref:methyl-accepting chemotaxis protein n=2 Tax=unclassified Bacillus (in: firmicutes) TaxID=185979 RepID=UPI00158761FA|nr:HAMP domain-containing methyl-accepting chemotaxis protein [Bacillus sp. cl95]